MVPGRKPNCAASVGPTSGPAPEMAEKWWPKRIQRDVGTKSRPLLSRSAGVAGRFQCLDAKKHVYCEKPFANVLEEANAAIDVCRKSDKVVTIGTQRRSDPQRHGHANERFAGRATDEPGAEHHGHGGKALDAIICQRNASGSNHVATEF